MSLDMLSKIRKKKIVGHFRRNSRIVPMGPRIGPSPLAKLLCGDKKTGSSGIDEVLGHLSHCIDKVVWAISDLDFNDGEQISLFAPFLARSVLELASTALLARLDPFRLLILREKQKQPNYEIDKANKSSIRWQGDVLSEKVGNLWDDKSLTNPTRALLGDYFTELIWLESFEVMLDAVQHVSGDNWISILRQKEARRFCSEVRAEFTSLYSELSKGIHHEIVIPLTASFDEVTVRDLLGRVLFNVSNLGLMLSVVKHAVNSLDHGQAIMAYSEVQKMELY